MKTIKLGKKPTTKSRPFLCTLSPLFSILFLVTFPSIHRPVEHSSQQSTSCKGPCSVLWIRTPWGAGEKGKWILEASLPGETGPDSAQAPAICARHRVARQHAFLMRFPSSVLQTPGS